MATRSPHLLPAVLLRELRAAARRRGTYWLRTSIAAGALLTLFLHGTGGNLASTLGRGSGPSQGAGLFALLHGVLSLVLLLAAPMIAADSLARERREGTLPLLGLTPLRPMEIVLGKAAAQILRLIPLWLACVPVLLIPVLSGGVDPRDVAFALGVEWIILAVGLASGLVATTVCRQWNQSAGLALTITLALGYVWAFTTGYLLVEIARTTTSPLVSTRWEDTSPWSASLDVLAFASGLFPGGFVGALPLWIRAILMRMLMAGVLGTFVFLGAAIAFAGWRVRKLLRPADRPASDAKTTSAPTGVAGSFLKQIQERQRSRWLQRNPARWLWAKAGPGSRSQIAWMSVVAAVWIGTLCLDLDSGGIVLIPPFIPLVLTVPMAMTSAASLRQEMEEGTLELLLVTPLETSQLVTARVLEAWSQFLPAVLLNLFLTGLASLRLESPPTQLAAIHLAGITSIIALPAMGIRYAVRRLHPLAGMLWSLLTAGILPFLIGLATVVSLSSGPTFPGVSDELSPAFWFGLGFGLTQFALSAVWGWLAARDLELRWYMFRPFQQRPG